MREMVNNLNIFMLFVCVGLFCSGFYEKFNKEKWVLFDSFRKSEKTLEKLIDEIPLAIFLVDPNNKYAIIL